MKKTVFLLLCAISLGACTKNDSWNWSTEMNSILEFTFPENGTLTIVESAGENPTVRLEIVSESVQNQDGTSRRLHVSFMMPGSVYSITGKTVRLSGKEIPGIVRFDEEYSNLCKTSTDETSGTMYFDTSMRWSGEGPDLYSGTRLNGDLIIRFKSDDGDKYMFRCTDLSVWKLWLR